MTATLVRSLDDYSYWLRSVNYYDNKLRVIQTVSTHQRGMVRTGSVLDFTGKVLHTKRDYTVTQCCEHHTYSGIFADGNKLQQQFWNGGYEAIIDKDRNGDYIKMMMQRYSSEKPVDRCPDPKKK